MMNDNKSYLQDGFYPRGLNHEALTFNRFNPVFDSSVRYGGAQMSPRKSCSPKTNSPRQVTNLPSSRGQLD